MQQLLLVLSTVSLLNCSHSLLLNYQVENVLEYDDVILFLYQAKVLLLTYFVLIMVQILWQLQIKAYLYLHLTEYTDSPLSHNRRLFPLGLPSLLTAGDIVHLPVLNIVLLPGLKPTKTKQQ